MQQFQKNKMADCKESEPTVANPVEPDAGYFANILNMIMDKIRALMGVEFAEFGGIQRLSKMNLVDPTYIPSMLVDVQERVHATMVNKRVKIFKATKVLPIVFIDYWYMNYLLIH